MAKILVVDDDDAVRESICDVLAAAGHEVAAAADGQEALELLERVPDVEVMVLDLFMPGLDGMAVLDALDADRPVVVVLSAFNYRPVLELRARLGARIRAYMVKPVPPRYLVRTIDECLRPGSQAAAGTGPPDVG